MNQLIDLRVLSLIAFALTNLALLGQVKGQSANTFFGTGAGGTSRTTASFDSGFGFDTLANVTTGSDNTAIGEQALFTNTTGTQNTATGLNALWTNSSGKHNTADGFYALFKNSTGSNNIASGDHAGYNLTTSSNNIDIGNLGVAGDANTIRIGNALATVYPDGTTHAAQTKTYIAGFTTAVTGSTVVVNATTHQVGMMTSSARFKDEIKPMNEASDAILALKPVTFRYKKDIDPDRTPQYGLVAEDVEKVNPALITPDADGKPYTVRYDAVNAMLLNEFLKEHQKVQRLEAALAAVNERLKAQDAKIDKVNAKVELTKPAPQTVLNQ